MNKKKEAIYVMSKKKLKEYFARTASDESAAQNLLKLYMLADTWDRELVALLCELYAANYQLLNILNNVEDITSINPETKEEEHIFESTDAVRFSMWLAAIKACKADLLKKNISTIKH